MRRGRHYIKNRRISNIGLKKPEMEISPINRNFSDDDRVVGKISVDSENMPQVQSCVKKKQIGRKKTNFLSNIKKEDLIIIGILFLLFNKHDDDDCEDTDDNNSDEGMFSIERIKRIIPIDKLTDNDILLVLIVYLML